MVYPSVSFGESAVETSRSRVIVEGHVQGVYFRESTRRTAQELGLAGWVRNLPDGGVEAVFEGPAEGVAHAVAWARVGPTRALVTSLVETAEEPEGLAGFTIRA
jgi:acylphosphatase